MALYTVAVTNESKGWSYSATEGDEWDPADDVVLVSPLTLSWSFSDDVVPSQLDPWAGAVNLVGRTAEHLPETEVGDYLTVDIRVGTAGDRIIERRMRVTTAQAELTGAAQYRARLTIGLTDLAVDWQALEPGWVYDSTDGTWGPARAWWRERIAEIGIRIGYAIGCPTWWHDQESPYSGVAGVPAYSNNVDSLYPIVGSFQGDARTNLDALLNSHHPNGTPATPTTAGHTHTWATVYAPAGYPTGYRRIGPDDWDPFGGRPDLTEPDTAVRILAVPASRKLPASVGLPLVFTVAGGVLTVTPAEPSASGYSTQVALDASWCEVPARLNRTRADAVNLVTVNGKRYENDGSATQLVDGEHPVTDAADVAARGISKREVDTQLRLPGFVETTRPAPDTVGDNYLTFEGLTIGGWSFDGVTVYSSAIPDAVAAWLLPIILPRYPGETDSDGRLVRHVTIYGLHDALRFNGQPVTGYITGGTLTIAGGDIVWSVDMTPGVPQWTDAAPAALTVAEIVTAGTGLTIGDTDPAITLADLAYVDH